MTMYSIEDTLAVPTCMQVAFAKSYAISTALVVKKTGEIIAERLGAYQTHRVIQKVCASTDGC